MAISLCPPGNEVPFPTDCVDVLTPPHVCLGDPSECIYCNPPQGSAHDPCSFVVGANSSRCNGLVGGLGGLHEGLQPFFCVGFGPGTMDATGSTDPFYSRVRDYSGDCAYRYFLQANIALIVEPCTPINYCPAGSYYAKNLCRWFIIGAGASDNRGWKMLCNYVEMDEYGPAVEQLVPKPLPLDLDMLDHTPAFIHLVAGNPQPYCFDPFKDVFCFSRSCSADPKWDCIGATNRSQVDALESPYIVCNVSYSTDRTAFPFSNPAEIELKNAAWAMVNEIVDQLDNSHDGGVPYHSRATYLWATTEEFGPDNFTLQELGFPPYPAVRGRASSDEFPGGVYAEYADVPIPLVCRARLTKAELPAVLTIHKVSFVMHLHVEKEGGSRRHRVHADIYIWLGLRVRLMPAAYEVDWPLQLIGRPNGGTDDPYDLRVEDPGESGVEHRFEILTPVGPSGERVWYEQSWRGLNSARQFSRGVPWQGVAAVPTCCQSLRAIDQLIIAGEINDCGELQPDGPPVELPQRYQGGVGLGIDWFGVEGC